MKITYEENFKSKRADGRHISTMAAHMEMLRNLKPALALPEKFTKEEFFQWKASVKKKLNELLLMPEFTEQPEPVLLVGTETGLFLGLICDDFKALVFNDMMVDHLHRYVSVTESDGKMDQNIGNWHVVPDMFNWFDFPDLCAAFAPKYLALNEGGGNTT